MLSRAGRESLEREPQSSRQGLRIRLPITCAVYLTVGWVNFMITLSILNGPYSQGRLIKLSR